jgi:hypothetical protein
MLKPTQWPDVTDVEGSHRLGWHAQIYEAPLTTEPLSRISIGLHHVRAADDLVIEFSGARNGWVIRMDRTYDGGGVMETVAEAVEVAFIPAWNVASPEEEAAHRAANGY